MRTAIGQGELTASSPTACTGGWGGTRRHRRRTRRRGVLLGQCPRRHAAGLAQLRRMQTHVAAADSSTASEIRNPTRGIFQAFHRSTWRPCPTLLRAAARLGHVAHNGAVPQRGDARQPRVPMRRRTGERPGRQRGCTPSRPPQDMAAAIGGDVLEPTRQGDGPRARGSPCAQAAVAGAPARCRRGPGCQERPPRTTRAHRFRWPGGPSPSMPTATAGGCGRAARRRAAATPPASRIGAPGRCRT